MKKIRKRSLDDLRPEYNFSRMRGGIRGKYVKRYSAGTNLALLERDVAKAFPTDAAVNDALRALLEVAAALPRSKRLPNKRIHRTGNTKSGPGR